MTRLIILVTLLLAQYARSDSESVETVLVDSTLQLKTEPVPGITQCNITTTFGKHYSYTPGSSIIPDFKGYDIRPLDKDSCSVAIYPVIIEHAGVWQIVTQIDEAQVFEAEITVIVEKKLKTIPSHSITVLELLYARASIAATPDELKTCEVISPSKEKIDLLSTRRENIQLFGKCGFQIKANLEVSGTWSLRVTTAKKNVIYTADVDIHVVPQRFPPNFEKIEPIELIKGEKGRFTLDRRTSKFCQLINPQGEKLPMIDGSCRYEIPVVTDHHAGVWFVKYAIDGQLDTVQLPFTVTVTSSRTISGTVGFPKKDEAEISCTIRHQHPQLFSFCRFTRPDGYVMNASPGVRMDRYTAFTSDEDDRQNEHQCTLLVEKMENRDYGSWKCEIFWGKNNEHAGSIVYVDRFLASHRNSTNVQGANVYVKKDDPFTVKCSANTVLDYCWLRSPNGTTYSVSSVEQQPMPPFTLVYQGAGLTMGECGAKIDSATYSDRGEWTCHVGVAGGREEKKTLTVYVKDSYLMVDTPLVEMASTRDTRLSCRILPSEKDRAIHYCRWVRPDGYGIYNGVTDRYKTSSNKSQCILVIQNANTEEDIGVWKCIAGISGYHTQELTAIQEVAAMDTGMKMSSVILICVLPGVIGVVVLSVILGLRYRYRLQHSQPVPLGFPASVLVVSESPKYHFHGKNCR